MGRDDLLLAPWPEFPNSLPGRLQFGLRSLASSFMMPGFAFVTGYVSKAILDERRATNLVKFTCAFLIQHSFVFFMWADVTWQADVRIWTLQHQDLNATNKALRLKGEASLEPPSYLPLRFFKILGVEWYLLAVIIWRCTLPLIARLRWPLVVSLALAMALMFTDAFLNSHSMLVFSFLPFFVCGYVSSSRQEMVDQMRKSMLAASFFVAVALTLVGSTFFTMSLVMLLSHGVNCLYGAPMEDGGHSYEWLMRYNYTESFKAVPLKDTYCQSAEGLLHVAVFYLLSFCLVFSFMGVVPVGEVRVLTKAGRNSIYIYLTQTWFVLMPLYFVAPTLIAEGKLMAPALALVASIFLTLAGWVCLGQQWVKSLCGFCVEPPVERCCTLP